MLDSLHKKCVSCLSFKNSNIKGYGFCCGNIQAFKEKTGQKFTKGGAAGSSFKVRKLDACSYYEKCF